VLGFERSCVRQTTRKHDLGPAKEFMARGGGPFCLAIALVEPHVPWTMGDASRYPVDALKLPAHIADTPRTRRDFAAYLAEITYMDRQVGDILRALEASGRAADTLVLFTSEQGAQFPGCKWTNYDAGVHTALVARWPGRIAALTRTDALGASCREWLKVEWIWDKVNRSTGFANARKRPMRIHENVLVFYRKQPTYNPQMTKGKPYVSKRPAGKKWIGMHGETGAHVTRNEGTPYFTPGRLQRASGATSGLIPEPIAAPYVVGLPWGAGLDASGL
jgi:hypothetical protein